MAIEAREELIRTGDRLAVPEFEQIFGFPVNVLGFEDLGVVKVSLSEPGNLTALLPDFEHYPDRYQVREAVCFLEAGQPVMAIVSGKYIDGERQVATTTLVNLAPDQEKVILASSETEPLNIGGTVWPGYNIDKHEKSLKLGLETLSLARHGDKFWISFTGQRDLLIQTGDRLATVPKQIYGLPLVFDGLKPEVVRVALNGIKDLQILVPEFKDRGWYQPGEATCILAGGQAILAIVSGAMKTERGTFQSQPILTLVNLAADPGQVVLASGEIRVLENTGAYWPGYSLTGHEQELKANKKQLLVAAGIRDNITIGFVR